MAEKLDRSTSKTAYPDDKPVYPEAEERGHHGRRSSIQILEGLIAEGEPRCR
jgi:hypothetical protein